MREHPIPQDITGYRFHIIGSMTLKQFAELGAGALLGLLVYATNLPDVFKWPFIFIVVGVGAAAAFLPLEERSMDHWITTFIKTIYKPTKFFWKRSQKIPAPFLYEAHSSQDNQQVEIDLGPARHERIKEYLASVQPQVEIDPFDQYTQQRLEQIMSVFDTVNPTQVKPAMSAHKPQLKVRVRSLEQKNNIGGEEAIVYEQQTTEQPLSKHQLAPSQVASQIEVPIELETSVSEAVAETEAEPAESQTSSAAYIAPKNDVQEVEGFAATLNDALPFPSKPTQPNKLVGMILTPQNELIPDSIVEITDEHGRVVRAVKSNALGQFYITTPLKKGTYTIRVDHDRYQFQPIEISLNNDVVDPVEIRSLS